MVVAVLKIFEIKLKLKMIKNAALRQSGCLTGYLAYIFSGCKVRKYNKTYKLQKIHDLNSVKYF